MDWAKFIAGDEINFYWPDWHGVDDDARLGRAIPRSAVAVAANLTAAGHSAAARKNPARTRPPRACRGDTTTQ